MKRRPDRDKELQRLLRLNGSDQTAALRAMYGDDDTEREIQAIAADLRQLAHLCPTAFAAVRIYAHEERNKAVSE